MSNGQKNFRTERTKRANYSNHFSTLSREHAHFTAVDPPEYPAKPTRNALFYNCFSQTSCQRPPVFLIFIFQIVTDADDVFTCRRPINSDTFAPQSFHTRHKKNNAVGTEGLADEDEENERRENCRKGQRFSTTSRTTLPLGPKGRCGLPLSSARTPPALPNVTRNWSWAFHCARCPGRKRVS